MDDSGSAGTKLRSFCPGPTPGGPSSTGDDGPGGRPVCGQRTKPGEEPGQLQSGGGDLFPGYETGPGFGHDAGRGQVFPGAPGPDACQRSQLPGHFLAPETVSGNSDGKLLLAAESGGICL